MAVSEHKAKRSVRCLIITVSDTRKESDDKSGWTIRKQLREQGHEVVGYEIVRDEPAQIESLLRDSLDRPDLEAILLNGGTGISPRDSTYEVVSGLLEKRLDGF